MRKLMLSVLAATVAAGVLTGCTGTDGSTSGAAKNGTATAAPAKSSEAAEKEEPADDAAVKVTAKRAEFKPTVLHDGSDFTSVSVTVTNSGDKEINVNPLFFTITDTSGSKHTVALGMDKDQIGTVKLAPGENATGTVTAKGSFTAKYVTYTDGLIGEAVRGNVS
ncbi:DUF4352 domain-containing protein [Streptomyces cinereoruber]|uniref:DUF4352 domain-containing protein n=1 Tax=Streptomyces cinereoruber TaxID=67260 RepID=UPI003632AA21